LLSAAVAATRLTWKGETIPISVAFGAHRLLAGEEPQVALAAADRAMYRNKRKPRPRRRRDRLGETVP
jgi:hypothetical protein